MLGGAGLITGGIYRNTSDYSNLALVAGGGMLIGAGFWVSVAGAGTWIAYAVKHHQYKKQQESLQYYHQWH